MFLCGPCTHCTMLGCLPRSRSRLTSRTALSHTPYAELDLMRFMAVVRGEGGEEGIRKGGTVMEGRKEGLPVCGCGVKGTGGVTGVSAARRVHKAWR